MISWLWPKKKKFFFRLGISLLLFFSNPLLARLAINAWEPIPKRYDELSKYEYGIVLGGITHPNRPPYDRIHFIKGADRLVHAIELYHANTLRKIIISGGSGTLTFEGKPESVMMADFAYKMGIPKTDILIDTLSKNTHQNAQEVKKLIGSTTDNLLITSAFHMYRASGCFEKTNIPHDTFPTDYYGEPIRWSPSGWLIPTHHAIMLWSKLIKEWIGVTVYKLSGYL